MNPSRTVCSLYSDYKASCSSDSRKTVFLMIDPLPRLQTMSNHLTASCLQRRQPTHWKGNYDDRYSALVLDCPRYHSRDDRSGKVGNCVQVSEVQLSSDVEIYSTTAVRGYTGGKVCTSRWVDDYQRIPAVVCFTFAYSPLLVLSGPVSIVLPSLQS